MRFCLIPLICFLFSVSVFAQTGSISGKIIQSDGKTPIPRASVFLSNSSSGTASNEDGSYNLNSVRPGQYTLVVTCVGFEDIMQTVLVGNEPIKLDILMKPKAIELRGVVITTAADWKKNYEMFKNDFIGISENSKQCKVVNPHVLDFIYHRSKQTLEAYSNEFLIVENSALGYRVKFLLKDFNSDKIGSIISWDGQALFEELPGSASQKKKWKQKRDEAYYGSAMHFYRSLYTNKLTQDGFVIRTIIRKPNPDRPPEELIRQKIKKFRETNRDSANYWFEKENMLKYKERLIKDPLRAEQISAKTDQAGLYLMGFTECLYVVYTKKHETVDFKDVYHPLDMENFETSVITLFKPYIVFDSNGIVVSQPAPLYEGTWSKAKLAELLPVDYVPSAVE